MISQIFTTGNKLWPLTNYLGHDRVKDGGDFSDYLGDEKLSRKNRLLSECEKLDVSIHIDDAAEASSGVYSGLRAVASEAELEKRLNAKKSLRFAWRSQVVSFVALAVSIAAFIKSYWQQ